MNAPKSWLKIIWLSKKISSTIDEYGNETITYSIPTKYKINHQPLSASSDTQMYGERSLQMQRAIIDKTEFINVFSDFDLAYLDGASPITKPIWDKDTKFEEGEEIKEPKNGYWANYRVKSVRLQNLKIAVYFERLDSR